MNIEQTSLPPLFRELLTKLNYYYNEKINKTSDIELIKLCTTAINQLEKIPSPEDVNSRTESFPFIKFQNLNTNDYIKSAINKNGDKYKTALNIHEITRGQVKKQAQAALKAYKNFKLNSSDKTLEDVLDYELVSLFIVTYFWGSGGSYIDNFLYAVNNKNLISNLRKIQDLTYNGLWKTAFHNAIKPRVNSTSGFGTSYISKFIYFLSSPTEIFDKNIIDEKFKKTKKFDHLKPIILDSKLHKFLSDRISLIDIDFNYNPNSTESAFIFSGYLIINKLAKLEIESETTYQQWLDVIERNCSARWY